MSVEVIAVAVEHTPEAYERGNVEAPGRQTNPPECARAPIVAMYLRNGAARIDANPEGISA